MWRGTLLTTLAIWIIPISGLPLPQHNPFTAELQRQPSEHGKEVQYELKVHPTLQLPQTSKPQHEQQPRVQVVEQAVEQAAGEQHTPHQPQTPHQQETRHQQQLPTPNQQQEPRQEQAEQQEHLPQEGQNKQAAPHQQTAPHQGEGSHQQEGSHQGEASHQRDGSHQQQKPHTPQAQRQQLATQRDGNNDLGLMSLGVAGGTAAFTIFQNRRLSSKLHAANKQIHELRGKHDRLQEELSRIDAGAGRRLSVPPPTKNLIKCILREYDLPENWEELSFLIPSEEWNTEGPKCPGWRSEYAVKGPYKKIEPVAGPSLDDNGKNKKTVVKPPPVEPAVPRVDHKPYMPSMANFKSWVSNTVNRLGSFTSKVTDTVKANSSPSQGGIWGGFNKPQLRPGRIF